MSVALGGELLDGGVKRVSDIQAGLLIHRKGESQSTPRLLAPWGTSVVRGGGASGPDRTSRTLVTGYTDRDTVERIHQQVPEARVLPKLAYRDHLAAAVQQSTRVITEPSGEPLWQTFYPSATVWVTLTLLAPCFGPDQVFAVSPAGATDAPEKTIPQGKRFGWG